MGLELYTYGLDAGDNLLTVQTPASSTTSTYDNLNQIDLRNAQPFVYDAAGNLLNDGQRTYAWDAEQRLIGIGYLATPAVSTILRYDGLGRRTAVKEYTNSNNYTETRYLWCGERICQARNASDAIIRRYYEEGELHVSSTGNTPYYYAQDHLGSVRDLVDASGKALASYDYDPYGKPTRSTASGSTRADYRYAGLFYHAPSGLYLTHYRAYDPVTARWLSRDPIGETGGVNLYGYVGDNPLKYTDPSGLHHEYNGGTTARCAFDDYNCAAGVPADTPKTKKHRDCVTSCVLVGTAVDELAVKGLEEAAKKTGKKIIKIIVKKAAQIATGPIGFVWSVYACDEECSESGCK